ncbi:hypothetical protein Tco_0284957 [Tanacetum coccineum]
MSSMSWMRSLLKSPSLIYTSLIFISTNSAPIQMLVNYGHSTILKLYDRKDSAFGVGHHEQITSLGRLKSKEFSSSERLADTSWDFLRFIEMNAVRTSAFELYASTMLGIKETATANWFVCLNSEKLVSKVFSLWSNPNKEPSLGRSCREELGTVAGVGTSVCCRCVMRGVGGGGRIVAE